MKNFTQEAFKDPMQEIIDQYANDAEQKDRDAQELIKNKTLKE